ncbi:hypothetical protein [Prescottella equi]
MLRNKNRNKDATLDGIKAEQRQSHLIPGVGPRIDGSQFGWLHFERLPQAIRVAENQLLEHDRQQLAEAGGPPLVLVREAADVEKVLLKHLGFTIPEHLETELHSFRCQSQQGGMGILHTVEFRRRWPALEGQPARELPVLPQVQVRFGMTSVEVAREVSKVHADALKKIVDALDQDDTESVRDWCAVLAAHCEHPVADDR